VSRSFTSNKKYRLFCTYVKRHLLLPKENKLLAFKYTVVWNVANIRGPFKPLASYPAVFIQVKCKQNLWLLWGSHSVDSV
jgi:hypothetical protein